MNIKLNEPMDEETHAALASGSADPAISLVVDCLAEMRGMSDRPGEAFVGAMLECEELAGMPLHAEHSLFAAIDRFEPVTQRSLRYAELSVLPAALVDAIRTAERQRRWKSAVRGVTQLQLNLPGRAKAEIIRIEAGTAVPRHSHKGRELTLCLVGGYSDEAGAYGPGDVAIADPSVRHQPKADDDGACFVLAITDAPLTFRIRDWLR